MSNKPYIYMHIIFIITIRKCFAQNSLTFALANVVCVQTLDNCLGLCVVEVIWMVFRGGPNFGLND